jgi:hypothetical protein
MWRFWLIAALASVAALSGAALAPGEAGAKGPGGERDAEAAPGITVTGVGFARGDREATDRALADARRRAAAVAAVLDIAVGAPEAVETPGLTQFGDPRPCRANGHVAAAGRCARAIRAAAAIVTFAIVGGGSGAASRRSVAAEGIASSRVEPRRRDNSRSIKRALLTARRAVTPRAAADAARRARLAAGAADLRLGPLVSVSETPPAYYYGPAFYETALGTFGPGRFCGIVRRAIVRRDPDTGVPRVVRRVPQRSCNSPTSYSLRFSVRYEAS